MPEGWWSRGVTPHLRSGAAAESARLRRRIKGPEGLPCVRGQWLWPGGDTPRPRSGAAAERSYQASEVRAAAGRSHPHPRPWPHHQEEQPEERWLSRHRRA